MALALDSTRHELQTEGINIPDTKQEQEELEGISNIINTQLCVSDFKENISTLNLVLDFENGLNYFDFKCNA